MTGAALFAGFVLVSGVLAPLALRDARWPERWPRLAVGAWLALVCTALSGVTALGLTAAARLVGYDTFLGVGPGCWTLVWGRPGSWAVVPMAFVALVGVSALPGAACVVVLALVRDAHGRRVHLDEMNRAAGEPPPRPPVRGAAPRVRTVVVDDPRPAAYCLPGRGGRIVVTSGALRVLSAVSLAAVVEHELSHLRARHQPMLVALAALERLPRWVPLLAAARPAVARLVEMAADDAAARRYGRGAVAQGLAQLVAASVRSVRLQAAARDVALRINRLSGRHPATGPWQWVALTSGLAMTAIGPVALTAGLWLLCC
ncbi:M56 family metallopeptidase [Streptomyces sp. OE57]|uniref:M56 family metallopeptidase n=1 Tax=Streptomyces lacaronensis TaxID=3379885 RepID=UPI0039B75172